MLIKNPKIKIKIDLIYSYRAIYWLLYKLITYLFFFNKRKLTDLSNWKLSNEFDNIGGFLPKNFDQNKGVKQHFLYIVWDDIRGTTERMLVSQLTYIFYRGILFTQDKRYAKKRRIKNQKLFMLWQTIVNPNFRYTITGFYPVYYRFKSRLLMFALQMSYILGKRFTDTDPYLKEIEQIEKETGKPFYPIKRNINGNLWTREEKYREIRNVAFDELLRRVKTLK